MGGYGGVGAALALGFVCATEQCVCVCGDEEDKQTSSCFPFFMLFHSVKWLLGLNKYDVIQESRLIFVDKEIGAGNEAKKNNKKKNFSNSPVFNRTHMYTQMHGSLSCKNQAVGQKAKTLAWPSCSRERAERVTSSENLKSNV